MKGSRAVFRAVLAVSVLGGVLVAGPLNPPAGPVASTYKTLSEVEPRIAINAVNTPGDADSLYKITAPGSYYLTGNITGVMGKHGIEIIASGVTLDLNGFDLAGAPGAIDGVTVTVNSLTNITVLNGSVRNWGGDGVDLGSAFEEHCRISNVTSTGNVGKGIAMGSTSIITNCVAGENSGDGFSTSFANTITNCVAHANTGIGISAGESCIITNCSAYSNATGISVFRDCTITNCAAQYNDLFGIDAGSGLSLPVATTITNCTANQNGGSGIGTGIDCTVSHCTASDNDGNGLLVSGGSSVTDCAAFRNTLNGIKCSSGCVIRNNNCESNGNLASIAAGINATSGNNRIEGNNCTGNDFGIDIDGAGNMIVRNSCADNTQNFVIGSNNIYGPIIDRTAPASPPAVGNAAAGTMGSTDPNANFSY